MNTGVTNLKTGKTKQVFIVDVGEEFEVSIMGLSKSVADPAGVIGSINYNFTATDSSLIQTRNPYHVVPNIKGYIERKPLV